MEPKQFIRIISKRIWAIVFLALMASAITYWYVKDELLVYRSVAQISTGIINSGISLNENNYAPFTLESRFGNLTSLLNSRRVIGLLSFTLFIHDYHSDVPFRKISEVKKEFAPQILAMADSTFTTKLENLEAFVPASWQERVYMDILEKMKYDHASLKERLKIYRVTNTDFIQIEFESDDPYLSAFVVNSLCECFFRFYRGMESKEANSSVDFFTNLAKQKKEALELKTGALQEFKSNNKIVNPDAQGQAVVDRISRLEMAKEDARQKIAALTEANKKIDRSLPGGLPALRNGSLSKENKEIMLLKNKISILNDKYFAGGLQDDAIQDSLRILRNKLQQTLGSTVSGSPEANKELAIKKINNEIDLEIAKANLNSISRELNRQKLLVPDFVTNEAYITQMQGEISVAREAYLLALDKLNSSKSAALNSGNELKLIEAGQPADEAEISYQKVAIVFFAGIVVFSFCIVLIFMLSYIDSGIRSPSQFEKVTNIPLIGVMNNLKKEKADYGHLNNGFSQDKDLVTYAGLLNNIRYEIESSNAKVILFTSAKEGEGKSFLIASLAYKLSIMGKMVLIIDTNFKNNSLTKRFEAATVLEKMFRSDSEDISISKTEIPGIDIIGCEGGNHSPSEILGPKKFEKLKNKLMGIYDYIFMEGASLNHYSDSKELMGFADKIVTIFSADSMISQEDKNAITYLNSLNGKMIGGVLNKVENENLNL